MGFWIFAGIVVIGLIYLYTKTYQRWNWKKIVLWVLGGISAPILILLIYIFGKDLLPNEFGSKAPPNQKGVITSLDGVSIGDKLSDIEFKKGKLTDYDKNNNKSGFDIKHLNDYSVIYLDPGKDTVRGFGILCSKAPIDFTKFNGIGCGDSGEKIADKFGKDLTILCEVEKSSPDSNPMRSYSVNKYGTRYILALNSVIGIRIDEVSDKPDSKKSWKACE